MTDNQVHRGDVRAWCPGCKAWKPFSDTTQTINGHGWISMSLNGFTECAGSGKKIRSKKRAAYRKSDRKWHPVQWDDVNQVWTLV